MKKYLVIALVVLVAGALSASSIMPPPAEQRLSGILQYGSKSVCQIPDYISSPLMENIYLIGNGFPTEGQYKSCSIDAAGYYLRIEGCKVFQVSNSSIQCRPSLVKHSPSLRLNSVDAPK